MQPRAKAELTKRKRGRPKGSTSATGQRKKYKAKAFSLTEKRNLFTGLKKCMPDDLEALQKYVPKRPIGEIEEFLERQKFYVKISQSTREKAPIEQWSMLANDLMMAESMDYTKNLSRILSIAANFEDHPIPSDSTPDYSAIYSCLSAILQGSELPDLGQLECAVILDLLHTLVDTLRRHETTEQRQIMIWKYMLLQGKFNATSMDKDNQRCRKAIENDFSDFTGRSTKPASAPGSAAQAQNFTGNCPSNSTSGDVTKQRDQLKNVGLVPSPEKRPKEGYSSTDTACVDDTTGKQEVSKPKKGGRKLLRRDSEKLEENFPQKPKMFTLNPFCIPASHLKLRLKPHLLNPTENNPNIVSKLPTHKTSLSGAAPEKPGCSTHHTTVVTMESPYRGRRRTVFSKRPKTTEIVVVAPGTKPHPKDEALMQNIEAISIEKVLKHNKGVIEIIDSADNKLILENKPVNKEKIQLAQQKNTEQNTMSVSALKEFIQEAENIEIVNDDQEFVHDGTESMELQDDSHRNLDDMAEGGVVISTEDQQMLV